MSQGAGCGQQLTTNVIKHTFMEDQPLAKMGYEQFIDKAFTATLLKVWI